MDETPGEASHDLNSQNEAQLSESKLPRKTSTASNGAPTVQLTASVLTDRALKFLANASKETLGACLVGLSATTYVVLGRVGLLLIGIVSGVVLHATWEGVQHGGTDVSGRASEERRRNELGLDIIHRVLKWRSETRNTDDAPDNTDDSLDVQLYSGKTLDYSKFRPETAAALNELTDAVIRDYVKWWYSPILPIELAFPAACRQTLTAFVLSISAHLSRKRPADTFLEFVTNSSSIMIVLLNELSNALGGSPTASVSAALDTYLEMKPSSSLANIMDPEQQEKKFSMVSEDLLQNYLEHKTYNCQPARIFFREMLAKVVLEMTLRSCSQPEWINGWIVYLLEEGEPELMNAIDAGVEGATRNGKEKMAVETNAADAALKENGPATTGHEKTTSRLQGPTEEEAMQEAKRLTQMIEEENARKLREQLVQQEQSTISLRDDTSDATTQGIATPASTQSDPLGDNGVEVTRSLSVDSANGMAEASDQSSAAKLPFTSFDQLVPSQPPTALGGSPAKEIAPLTLFGANISIFDDSVPGEKSVLRAKPSTDYLIQIEPASSQHPGWMIARKFADFETLHEILRRISIIAGVAGFAEAHAILPNWKGHTKSSLRGELERYLNDAVRFQPLAESEGMKRFLEKDNGLTRSPSASKGGFPGIGWPTPAAFENMGKGMMDVLTKAPREVAGGGKALFGGVTGALGSLGPKRNSTSVSPNLQVSPSASPAPHTTHKRAESTISPLPQMRKSQESLASHKRAESTILPLTQARKSQDSVRSLSIVDTQPAREPQMERRPSWNPELDGKHRPSSSRSSMYGRSSRDHSRANSRAPSVRDSMDLSPVLSGDQILDLPPLPTEISDDYGAAPVPSPLRQSRLSEDLDTLTRATVAEGPGTTSRKGSLQDAITTTTATKPAPKPKPPLSEQEAQVTIELFFAIITELYSLSSAWQIRKTLLQAAKSFLLRPGNPQLESIRALLQSTVLDANTSDEGIAAHLKKLRQNSLPTEEELKAWPKPMTEQEKEALRVKARKLLIERGMPMALTSVMGNAASGEALGKLFDCLQIEKVARGLMFGLLLQGLRAVAQ